MLDALMHPVHRLILSVKVKMALNCHIILKGFDHVPDQVKPLIFPVLNMSAHAVSIHFDLQGKGEVHFCSWRRQP